MLGEPHLTASRIVWHDAGMNDPEIDRTRRAFVEEVTRFMPRCFVCKAAWNGTVMAEGEARAVVDAHNALHHADLGLPPLGGPPIDDMLRTGVAMATVLGAEVDLIGRDDRMLVEGVLGRRVSWVSAGGHVERSGIVDSDGWEVKFVRYPISSSAGAASVAEQVFGGIETVVRRLARAAGARRIKVGVKPGASDDHVWIGGLAVGPTEAPS